MFKHTSALEGPPISSPRALFRVAACAFTALRPHSVWLSFVWYELLIGLRLGLSVK